MLRYKRWTFEAWYQSECTNIPSLVSWLAWYHLETTLEKKSLDNICMLVFHFIIQTYNYHTPHKHGYRNLKLVPCKETYEMHIQMYHTSSWACSPYLCAQNFNWFLSFVISLPLCQILPLSLMSLFFPFVVFSPS